MKKMLFFKVLVFVWFFCSFSFANEKHATLIVDHDTGEILHEENSSALRYPASLTKMMTLYLTFEAIDSGDLNLHDNLMISYHASSMPKTNLNLKPNDYITVEKAIISTAVKSANDAAVVLAEAISGSEEAFAELMTRRARDLGMYNTRFKNASGLPNSEQLTTARDLAKLAIALKRDYPHYYHFFSIKSFSHKGITYHSHNRVSHRFPGADGLKTGYIYDSGFNLVTSARRGNKRLIGVVLGGETAAVRDSKMMALLARHFGDPDYHKYLANNKTKKNLKKLAKARNNKRSGKAKQIANKTPAIKKQDSKINKSVTTKVNKKTTVVKKNNSNIKNKQVANKSKKIHDKKQISNKKSKNVTTS